MIEYEDMSLGAKRIFTTADLFGGGGKSYNAEFAARILYAAANHLGSCNASTELLAIAAELEGAND